MAARNCCPVRVYTEDGRVVKIEGDPDGPLNKGGVCLKCLSQIQTVYSPRHVPHPMKRVGERGENKWEAISWDEAVDLAGEQIATAVKKHGPYSYRSARGGGGAYIEWETSGLDYTFGGCNSLASGACQCAMPRDFVSTTSVGFNCCVDMDSGGSLGGHHRQRRVGRHPPRRHGARLRAVGQPAALLQGGPRRPRADRRPVEPRREDHRRGPLT